MLEVAGGHAMVVEPKVNKDKVDVVAKEAKNEQEEHDAGIKELEENIEQSNKKL